MINNTSVQKIDSLKYSDSWVYPDIDEYCFVNIPEFVISLFTDQPSRIGLDVLSRQRKRFSKVIFILIDAFGWNIFYKYKDKFPLLKKLMKQAMVSKFTSQFPSTTSCQITTILTGLSVGESGVYEWRYYEPFFDEIIKPLECRIHRTEEPFILNDVDSSLLFPESKFLKRLHSLGLDVYISNHKDYAHSLYNQSVCRGFDINSYKTSSEALINLCDAVKSGDRGFFYQYFGEIDSISHEYGPFSKHTESELENLLHLIEKNILEKFDEFGEDTLLVLTADHGHIQVDPEKLLYINKLYPEINKYIAQNKAGNLIVPAGSQRDFFLHIQKQYLDKVLQELQIVLDGKAKVLKTSELMQKGVFGEVGQRLKDRIGNLVILPYEDYSFWWYEEQKQDSHKIKLGNHGGLSRDEMEIPFITYS